MIRAIKAERDRWDEGIEVVLSVQRETGLPDPKTWTQEALARETRKHQEEALVVWITVSDENKVVGHSLAGIVPISPTHPDWSMVEDERVSSALASGTLVEIEGVSVPTRYVHLCVARAITHAQVEWIKSNPTLTVVTSVWRNAPSSHCPDDEDKTLVSRSVHHPADLFLYNN